MTLGCVCALPYVASRTNIASCLLCAPWKTIAPGMAANSAQAAWSVSPWNLMVQTKLRTSPDARHVSTNRNSRAGYQTMSQHSQSTAPTLAGSSAKALPT